MTLEQREIRVPTPTPSHPPTPHYSQNSIYNFWLPKKCNYIHPSVSTGNWFQDPHGTKIQGCSNSLYNKIAYNHAYSWPSAPVNFQPWLKKPFAKSGWIHRCKIRDTEDWLYIEKKSAYEWTHEFKTHDVQGSTVYNSFRIIITVSLLKPFKIFKLFFA